MYTKMQTESVSVKWDQAKKLKIRIPQHYPSLNQLEGITVRLVYAKECLLLNLLVMDVRVEVVVTYLGSDQQMHVLNEEFSLLHTTEKPQGEVSNFQVLGTDLQSDYYCDVSQKEGERVREMDVLVLLRLVCHLSFVRILPERRSGISHRYPGLYRSREIQRTYSTRRNSAWKRG